MRLIRQVYIYCLIISVEQFQNTQTINSSMTHLHNIYLPASLTPMTKYSKVYLRNKKQSNISLPLRFSLLRSIFLDNMTVKHAALKWKIHYSSVKIIARQARKANLQIRFDQQPKPDKCCAWRELAQEQKQEQKLAVQKEGHLGDSTDSSMSEEMENMCGSKIEIVSTIGWSYMCSAQGVQNI